jgi:uncharacterized membrane protein
MKPNWLYIFPVLGFLAPFVLVIIWNLTHQKQIKSALKDKQTDVSYSDKLSANYTAAQKKWTLIIVFYLLIVVSISIFLLLTGKSQLASLIIPFAPIGWLVLIKLGNRVTK